MAGQTNRFSTLRGAVDRRNGPISNAPQQAGWGGSDNPLSARAFPMAVTGLVSEVRLAPAAAPADLAEAQAAGPLDRSAN
jgi:hypothetical protein